MADRETPRIQDAYREYLKLGINRSIEKLQEQLIEVWGEDDAPSISTLGKWSSSFGWQSRVLQDDEMINRRALERLRTKLAVDTEKRRDRRLQLSDIQLQAAAAAMLEDEEKEDALGRKVKTGNKVPVNLHNVHPQTLRAINDTIRVAGEIQRLDGGMPTHRIAGAPQDVVDGEQVTIRAQSDAALDEIARFLGLEGPGIIDNPADSEDDDEDDGQLLLTDRDEEIA